MRQDPHSIRSGHSLDLQAFRKTTSNTDIGLDNIQTALLDRIAESPAARELLTASNAQRQLLPDFPVALDLVGSNRLLVPVEILVGDPVPYIQSSTHIVGAIGIHGEQGLCADRLAYRPDVFKVVFSPKTDLHLHRRKTSWSAAVLSASSFLKSPLA